MDLHSEIRRIATTKHVLPAIASKKREFSIAVRDLMDEAASEGIPTVQRAPAFCKSIQTGRFLRDHGLRIRRVDGPVSKVSTTVVVHYEIAGGSAATAANETPEERAVRLTEKLRGLLKEEIAAYGGGEAYLRWVRGEDDEAA